jgi:hypothetical protein
MFKYNNLSEKYEKQIKEILKNNDSDFFVQKIDEYFFIKDKEKMAIISVKEAFFDKNGVIIYFWASTSYLFCFKEILYCNFGDFYISDSSIRCENSNLYETINYSDDITYPIQKYYTNNKSKIMLPVNYLIQKNIPKYENSKVSYKILNKDEYNTFLNNNYITEENTPNIWSCYTHPRLFGFTYASFLNLHYECNFLIGTIPYNDKQVMVGIIKFNPRNTKFNLDEEYCTYIGYAETNYFYRRNGIYNEMVNLLLENIDTKYLILSSESEMGSSIVSKSKGTEIIGTQAIIKESIKRKNLPIEALGEEELYTYVRKNN